MPINRVSLCNVPQNSPLTWVEYLDTTHHSVIEVENFLDSLPIPARLQILAKIMALKDLASIGKIPKESRNFEPISLYPDLFELKWSARSNEGKRVLIRQYHAEPNAQPRILLALHMHLKRIEGSEIEILQMQNLEISFAKFRLETGRKRNWML